MNLLERIKTKIAKMFPGTSFTRRGIVEGWTLFAPVGGQWTTIDGIEYWTMWDYKTKDWGIGDFVEFKITYEINSPYPIASDIKKIHEAIVDGILVVN